ncbi:MAG: division/cell wall cluster transcriptional repressor MraZ [Anaerolineaceae bacterium]|jgi:MraZ protein
MFLSHHQHSIDEKGRMTIPASYREQLQDGAYITQGFDQNLIVLPRTSFERISTRINQMSLTDPAARQLRRLIFSHAEKIEFDRAGRILIPLFLRESALLANAAEVVGAGNYFEIWSPELWTKQDAEYQNPEFNNQRYAALDLTTE